MPETQSKQEKSRIDKRKGDDGNIPEEKSRQTSFFGFGGVSSKRFMRDIHAALKAVRRGDFSRRLPYDLPGLEGEVADLFNEIVEINQQMERECWRVSRQVVLEGQFSQRIQLAAARGGWRSEADSINQLIDGLVQPVSETSRVITAVANGDLSQRMLLEVEGRPLRGEFQRIAQVINNMVAQLRSFSGEVTRITHQVGVDGRLGVQAEVEGVAGVWRELTDNVNTMASTLTNQVREISDVTAAVAQGDLERKITVEARGEIADLKNTINTMVDQLNIFSREVNRVAREVGTEGVLGGQAVVPGVSGIWAELAANLNSMASNLTLQVRGISKVVGAVARGDLRQRLRLEASGEIAELAMVINDMTQTLETFSSEVTRVARKVGTDGVLDEQAEVPRAEGIWRELTDNVNGMATNLTNQVRNIAEVATSVANGDLSRKITVDARGEVAELKATINTMVDSLNLFSQEVTRVAREVGTEGILGGQAKVANVSGVWLDLTENVNAMATNLTNQIRGVVNVVTAIARGDLKQRLRLEARGEVADLVKTINEMTNTLNRFSGEVTRVAREVGIDGVLGGQADVAGAEGTWRDLTDNVNGMASNLTNQVRNIAEVATAVANGDLSRKITVEASGEVAELKTTINDMVDRLNVFGSEVTRVAREVGTEGVLGGQAEVPNVAGIWADLTANVNGMATNLTDQVRNIAEVTTAVARGDLTRKITVEASGEVQRLANTINTMVDTLATFSEQVTEVARQVGTDGVLGGQAEVKTAEGTWRDLTDNVNNMAANLTNQVRNIAEVATAVANGDLSRKITVDARGEVADLKTTLNDMVDQLNVFGSEVTRVAREVGTEGVLGGQAKVSNVAGIWADLTANVNGMATNLTDQVRNIAEVTTAVAKGNLTRKITVEARGEVQLLAGTINTMVDTLATFSEQVTEVARQVGTDGVLGGQAEVKTAEGTWRDLTDNVNNMAANLTNQVRNIAEVATAVANGDLSRKITVEASGEVAELKTTINDMVDRLNVFGSEVTRVAREVGTEGVLGGQAVVPNVAGIWADLTANVNGMATNLTDQVRNIAEVTTAVARGNLTRKITVEARGEVQRLADTINTMVDTLATFSEQVTEVARQVGTEGVLGGQAEVAEAMGVWRDLTDNVNTMAANLTNQVRAIADVATAVTRGDLTQVINIEARGEIEILSNNINTMIASLQKTTSENENINWLQTGVGQLNDVMRGEQEVADLANKVVSQLATYLGAQIGTVYLIDSESGESKDAEDFRLIGTYAFPRRKGKAITIRAGEGLAGQAVLEKQGILFEDVPDDYIRINSSLGGASPRCLLATPFLFEGDVKGVIELGFLKSLDDRAVQLVGQVMDSIAIGFDSALSRNRLNATLKQSQALAEELQSQQEELKQSNEQLEEQTRALESAQRETEERNRQLEEAQSELNERAEQLTLSSKYKSEFLANMSHELRTPLNSILLLSQTLASGKDGAEPNENRRHAQVIHEAGSDLLQLINEILDLAKIEAGKMAVRLVRVEWQPFADQVYEMFRKQAEQKGLAFRCEVDPEAPPGILSDKDRIQQVMRNFLSNSLKFTESGSIGLNIHSVSPELMVHAVVPGEMNKRIAAHPKDYVALSVTDTGTGIPREKFQVIFEAFQQADGTTSRKYGGTGLGLSISRQIADMLEGVITLDSRVGKGSTFSLILPLAPSENLEAAATQEGRPAWEGAERRRHAEPSVTQAVPSTVLLRDDQAAVTPQDDRILLIVEDDPKFAHILLDLGRRHDFKVVFAGTGTEGIRLAERYLPAAIILDIQLPVMDGWEVLRHLKKNDATRHIPVHVISVVEETVFGYRLGAAQYLVKPVDKDTLGRAFEKIEEHLRRKARKLLVVEDNDVERNAVVDLLDGEDVDITAVGTGKEALAAIRKTDFDAMVLDLKLPDMDGYDLLKAVNRDDTLKHLSTIVYTGKDLSPEDERKLREYAESIVLKTVESPARLLEETTIFLHRVAAELSDDKKALLRQIARPDEAFENRTVLIVDDDIRNTYALSTVLEDRGLTVLTAADGRQGIEQLRRRPEIDLVLMDIMMPEMDGLEAIRIIRKQKDLAGLPVIALTAKALKEDQEQCLAAGASDYMSKPVDHEQLMSLIRVWLSVKGVKEGAAAPRPPAAGKPAAGKPARGARPKKAPPPRGEGA